MSMYKLTSFERSYVLVTASVQCKMQVSRRRLHWSGLTTQRSEMQEDTRIKVRNQEKEAKFRTRDMMEWKWMPWRFAQSFAVTHRGPRRPACSVHATMESPTESETAPKSLPVPPSIGDDGEQSHSMTARACRMQLAVSGGVSLRCWSWMTV